MRIGTKLLLTYLILIGAFAVGVRFALPRWVETAVTRAEQQRLDRQAAFMAERIVPLIRTRTLNVIEELLADETVLIVDQNGVIVRTSNEELRGRRLPLRPPEQGGRTTAGPLVEVPGMGPALISQVSLSGVGLRGHSLVLIRERAFVQDLARPITTRLYLLMGLLLIAAPLVSGLISRDLVRRLNQTGEAARAVADGDLARRAPEKGSDEITALARHFNHMAGRIQVLVEGLRKSEKARQDLLVTVSHELRTPITSISGFAEALVDGTVQAEEKRQRYYKIIAGEAGRLTRLINDLFDVSKLEAGQMELRLQSLPVAAWLVQFAEGFQPSAESKQVTLDVIVTPEAERSRVYGDRDRLDQILNNLAGNALRFTPEGSDIIVRASVQDGALLVEVTDHGPGLAPGEEERVFQRFYQGHQRTKGHAGAGLGLAIVKSLVEAHGGRVGVRSLPGAGATFWFSLRLAEGGAPER